MGRRWVENEIDHVLIVEADCEVNFNRNEIQSIEWLDNSSLSQMMERKGRWKSQMIAPWFESIFKIFYLSGILISKGLFLTRNSEIIRCGTLSVKHPENSASNVLAALGEHRDIVEEIIQQKPIKNSTRTFTWCNVPPIYWWRKTIESDNAQTRGRCSWIWT